MVADIERPAFSKSLHQSLGVMFHIITVSFSVNLILKETVIDLQINPLVLGLQ